MPSFRFDSHGPDETLTLARRIGAKLSGHDLVFLAGDLGSGKTLFAKGLYLGLDGPDPDQVTSPTYTVVNRYDDCDRVYYHVDLYRLKEARHLLGMEYEDFLYLNDGLTVVEWPKFAREVVEETDVLFVDFEAGTTTEDRRMTLRSEGDHYDAVFEELASC